ncbi:MAG: metallophosphoesterase family protein [bacterium]|jgi:3',5'-cyclic AMP phosphodiesterase CpdA|nr:metallophosphoesterase [Phycisphaerales bacterium]MCE2653367.1 metallophosphoesterase [Planctomycetaceae bacterium]
MTSNPSLDQSAAASALSRRQALLAGALGLGGAMLGACAGSNTSATGGAAGVAASARRSLRIAHLTDLHIQPELRATEGVTACLKAVAAEKPDLIITGGDLIFDGFAEDKARTQLQWDLLTRTFADNAPCPVLHTLGNHDIWGWHKGKSKTTGTEPGWGKAWACQALKMERPYNVSEHNGWRIIRLDSTHPDATDPNGYIARLDPAQLDWLEAELKRPTPAAHTLVVSHIPILSATPLLRKPNQNADEDWLIRGGLMHTDSAEIRALLESPQARVRAAISGHMHRLERLDVRGITYMCNGAVSGSWWKGPHHEAQEGFMLLDMFSDGAIASRYCTYGWTADRA